MKTILNFVGVAVAVSALSAFSETSVLVVREEVCVEEWRVSDAHEWTKKGVWLEKGKEAQGPHCVAAANGIVYLGDRLGDSSKGAILKFSPEGKYLGVLAKIQARPESLAIHGDFLYVSSAFGANAHRLFRYRLSDGKGGVCLTTGLSVPRTLAFGADGVEQQPIKSFLAFGEVVIVAADYEEVAGAFLEDLRRGERQGLFRPAVFPEMQVGHELEGEGGGVAEGGKHNAERKKQDSGFHDKTRGEESKIMF